MEVKQTPLAVRILFPELDSGGDGGRIDHEDLLLAERRAKVCRLYARGKTMRQIAEETKSSPATVCRDINDVLRSLLLTSLEDIEVKRVMLLAKLKVREAALWDAFDRSQGESTETSTARRSANGNTFDQVGVKRRQRDGDPRWMKLLEGCWEQEARLHGVGLIEDLKIKDRLPPVKLVAGFDPVEVV